MSSFDAEMLEDAERIVAACSVAGTTAILHAVEGVKPSVRAALIRHLLLGGQVAVPGKTAVSALPGVRIRGAHIEGVLDLSDCARPGGGLPTLELEDCHVPNRIDLSAARLARLSLVRCCFTHANLRETDIDGPLDFTGSCAYDDSGCWIDARGALINGAVIGNGANLTLLNRDQVEDGDRRAALWLAGTTIRGSLLMERFRAIGGVSLDSASVRGDVVLTHGTVEAGETDAFRAQNANIGGVLVMRHLQVRGVVWLPGIRVGGILEMSDTAVAGSHPEAHRTRHARTNEDMAVIAADAEIGASVRLSPNFQADGLVSFTVAKVRGYFSADGAKLRNWSVDGTTQALNGTHAEIAASLSFDGAVVEGRLDIAGARIGGHLSLIQASLYNQTDDSTGKALEAVNTTIGGNLEFGRYSRDGRNLTQNARRTDVAGAIDLTGAHIGGELAFSGTWIDNPPPEKPDPARRRNQGIAIIARQIHVGASVLMNRKFVSDGATILTGATIGRDLVCDDAKLSNSPGSAIYAKDIEVGDDLKLTDLDVMGELRFERASITGSVVWRTVTIGSASNAAPHTRTERGVQAGLAPLLRRTTAWLRKLVPSPGPAEESRHTMRLDLSHAKVGASLKCQGLRFDSPARVDLTGMQVKTLDLSRSREWGKAVCDETRCPIALDGLTYERIVFPTAEIRREIEATNPRAEPDMELRRAVGIPVGCWRWAAPRANRMADRLLDWLLRDFQPNDRSADPNITKRKSMRPFNPQPYRQLVRVLRAQGNEDDARYISIMEQWVTPRRGAAKLFRRLYGVFFGFGFLPGRAVLTLLAYVVFGTILAEHALVANLMVETPRNAATAFTWGIDSTGGSATRAYVEADTQKWTTHELTCSDMKGSYYDGFVFALDTVLPFIPLHQETKCELSREHDVLRVLRAFYAMFGWILTSLTLLTVSGILKRSESDPA